MRLRSRGILLLACFAAVACGEDTPLAVGDALSNEEAAALAEVVMSQGLESSYGADGGQALAPARVPVSHEQQIEAPCPLGGSVTIDVTMDGDVDEQTGNADVTVSQILAHQACSVLHEETDLVFTLDGDPSSSFVADVTVQNESDFSFVGRLSGRVAWATDDERSGSCELGIDFDMSGTAETEFSVSSSGQVCGVDVSESLTVGAT